MLTTVYDYCPTNEWTKRDDDNNIDCLHNGNFACFAFIVFLFVFTFLIKVLPYYINSEFSLKKLTIKEKLFRHSFVYKFKVNYQGYLKVGILLKTDGKAGTFLILKSKVVLPRQI